MNQALFAAALSIAIQPTEVDRRTAARRKRGYDPGPIANYDRRAIRAAAAAERKAKYEAKMARRAARK